MPDVNVTPELTVHISSDFVISLVIQNPTEKSINVSFSVKATDGFRVAPLAPAAVPPRNLYYVRVRGAAPDTKLPGWQQFTVSAESEGKNMGTVPLRMELSTGWVASVNGDNRLYGPIEFPLAPDILT